MKKIETWKTVTLIVALLVAASLVNGAHDFFFAERESRPTSDNRSYAVRPIPPVSREQPQQTYQAPQPVVERSIPEPERTVQFVRQKTPEELAAERTQFLARYMNAHDRRSPGVQTVAIVAVNENGKLNGTLATILADRIKGEDVKTLTSLFTPEFVSDGFFKDAFNDSPAPIARLELGEVVNTLLLAQVSVEYVSNPSLQDLITARMKFDVVRVSVARRAESQAWTWSANGPGFKQSDARAAAEERIIKQLSTDTKFFPPKTQ